MGRDDRLVPEISRLAAFALAATLASACVSPAAAPSSSPTPSPSPTESPSPSASPSPSPTTTAGVFTNFVLGYRIDSPAPWRRSSCLSSEVQTQLPAGDGFVRVSEKDERGTDTGFPFDVLNVRVEPNPDRLTAERWVTPATMGSMTGQTIEATTLDGRNALAVRPSLYGAVTYVLAIADRVFVVSYQSAYNDASGLPAMERMARSFHLLTDQERASAPSPAAVPSRSAQTIAAALVDGFTNLDADLLATVMAPCMAAALEQAGGTFTPRGAFATQLRESFANGLRVAVERAVESDTGGAFLKATWTQSGSPSQRRDLYMRANGEVWSWYLILTRQPVR